MIKMKIIAVALTVLFSTQIYSVENILIKKNVNLDQVLMNEGFNFDNFESLKHKSDDYIEYKAENFSFSNSESFDIKYKYKSDLNNVSIIDGEIKNENGISNFNLNIDEDQLSEVSDFWGLFLKSKNFDFESKGKLNLLNFINFKEYDIPKEYKDMIFKESVVLEKSENIIKIKSLRIYYDENNHFEFVGTFNLNNNELKNDSFDYVINDEKLLEILNRFYIR